MTALRILWFCLLVLWFGLLAAGVAVSSSSAPSHRSPLVMRLAMPAFAVFTVVLVGGGVWLVR